jgi:uncharacterized membrane protein YcaP (DUF421 family)
LFLQLTIKLLLGFVGLFIITKVLGKTQFSQVTPFDFISAIILGEVVGSTLYDEKTTVIMMLYALLSWGLLMLVIKMLGQKSLRIRGWIDGRPSIVIRNGRIIREELKKNRINIHDLMYMLRQSNAFSVREVEYALMEPNGSISILKKASMIP